MKGFWKPEIAPASLRVNGQVTCERKSVSLNGIKYILNVRAIQKMLSIGSLPSFFFFLGAPIEQVEGHALLISVQDHSGIVIIVSRDGADFFSFFGSSPHHTCRE